MLFSLLVASSLLRPTARPILPTPPAVPARRRLMPRGRWAAGAGRTPRLRFASYSTYSAAPDGDSDALSNAEAQMLQMINADREAYGLSPLALDRDLVQAARNHCRDMCTRGYFEHESSLRGQRTPLDRYRAILAQAGEQTPAALTLGENIFYCSQGSVDGAHRTLMNSPGHRANILSDRFTRAGVAVLRDATGEIWVTEMFLRDRP